MNQEAEEGASFDPRSWVGAEAGGTGASPPRDDRVASASHPIEDRRETTLAAAVSLAILLAGAVLAWSQHADRRVTVGASDARVGNAAG